MISYGLFLSMVIGIIAALFLVLEGMMSEPVWSNNSHLWQTIAIIIGSLLLYLLLKYWPNLPKTAHDSIQELKQNQTIDYQDVFLNLLVTLIILTFGAGVGPEAALLSAIISLSIWQADNLRYLYFQYDELQKISVIQRLKRLLNPVRYRQKYDENLAPKHPALLKQKKLLYVVFSINGVLAFWMLLRATDQPSFITKLGQSHWQLSELWLVPVLMIVGFLISFICKKIYQIITKQTKKLQLSLAVKIFVGAIGIILVAYFVPDLLFSGQHSLHLLVGSWRNQTPLYLMTMALLKLVFLMWCLSLHWRGGDIFPITFAAMTMGFAIAGLLPGYDILLIVSIIATTVMSELASPIVAGIFLIFFFPVTVLPIIVIVAGLMFLKNKYITTKKA